MRMKRNYIYSLGLVVLLAGAASAWRVEPRYDRSDPHSTDARPIVTSEKNPPAIAKVSREEAYRLHVLELYQDLGFTSGGPGVQVFNRALTGFYNLQATGKLNQDRDILSIVDFTKSSREKRLWIIDLRAKKVVFNTWVAHGKNSGGDQATRFSNTESSHQSSLGFYLTGEVYYGKHGRSLRLDGLDPGFNSNARKRAIVLHGADYVSQGFIDRIGRLGRSYGCPAVPVTLSDEIIDQIREKTVLYIHGKQANYQSDFLNVHSAATYLLPVIG